MGRELPLHAICALRLITAYDKYLKGHKMPNVERILLTVGGKQRG